MENHAVCIPIPAQGHIRPMLKLAQLLHFKFGFHITFINTHHIHQTLFKNHNSSFDQNKTPIFRFESLPKGGEDDDPKDILSIINSVVTNKLELPLKELLLSKLCTTTSSNGSKPRVTCMISDVGMSSFTLTVAEELGIPAVLLETASACGLLAYFHCRQLLDKGIIPLKDKTWLTNGYLEKSIDCIPSLKGTCLKDMPTFVRTTDPNDMMLNIVMLNAHRALNSSLSRAILINTFDALEQDVLKELSTISPYIHPIGPLNLLVDYHISSNDTTTMDATLLCEESQEDNDYMKWLDSQEPKSVLYVSFGTVAGIIQETLIELAWGLANSHAKFLWIVRPDQVIGELDSLEFDRFEKEIEERGMLSSWCDQERVLSHPSIGGFLTHCGWNSTVESISNGVPMICYPLAAEQVTNSWYCCNCLGIGVNMSKEVRRDEVEMVVKELMEGEKGKDMGTKALEWRKLAREVTMSSLGSSYVNLQNIVTNVLNVQH